MIHSVVSKNFENYLIGFSELLLCPAENYWVQSVTSINKKSRVQFTTRFSGYRCV